MIPPELRMAAGFFLGALICSPIALALGGMLAGAGREDAEMAAFRAGVQYERNARARAVAQLAGDEDTELGRIEA